jgi:5-hydroxyisourate hydrolase-like protein (transthyretin family)
LHLKKNIKLNGEKESRFGFTLVRRHPLSKEEIETDVRTTYYEYFCPDRQIASFSINEIDLGLYNRKFTCGSIVKLYSYQLPKGSRSDITLDLWRDLNQYMYHLPLPISVYEKRDYRGKIPSKPVLGNRTRITIDSRDKVNKTI